MSRQDDGRRVRDRNETRKIQRKIREVRSTLDRTCVSRVCATSFLPPSVLLHSPCFLASSYTTTFTLSRIHQLPFLCRTPTPIHSLTRWQPRQRTSVPHLLSLSLASLPDFSLSLAALHACSDCLTSLRSRVTSAAPVGSRSLVREPNSSEGESDERERGWKERGTEIKFSLDSPARVSLFAFIASILAAKLDASESLGSRGREPCSSQSSEVTREHVHVHPSGRHVTDAPLLGSHSHSHGNKYSFPGDSVPLRIWSPWNEK